jgi:hypothetical protein
LSDGRTVQINDMTIRKKTGATEIIIPFQASSTQKASINTTRYNIKQASITLGNGTTGNTVTGTFSDGNTRDATQLAETVSSPGVFQINIELGDSDADGHPDFIWSPRSNLAVTSQSESTNRSSLPADAFKGSSAFVKILPLYFNTNNANNEPVLLAGNHGSTNTPGPAARPGTPIGGIIVKGGKNPGGQMRQLQTNDYGEFEYTGLDAGNYRITAEYEIYINDQTIIEVGDADEDGATTRAQDHNSSRSNKTASSISPTPGDSTITAFNSMLETLRELDTKLQNDAASNKAGISTSRSNLRKVSSSIAAINNDLQNGNTTSAQIKMQNLNTQILALQQSLASLGAQYTSISNVLKTKHDTAKNSVGNIR